MKKVRPLWRWSGFLLTCIWVCSAQAFVVPAPDCDWRPGQAHKMHWPQTPDLTPTAVDVDVRPMLADDFLCAQSGPITDFHIWGGFPVDAVPNDDPAGLTFNLSLYSDVPATAASWSQPGNLLWSQMFQPGEYNVRQMADGNVGWMMPLNGVFDPCDHWSTYQFNFCVEKDPFIQTQDTVYWLAVEVYTADGTAVRFGWRNTLLKLNWNDAAVVLDTTNQWIPLVYPADHPWSDRPLNLAFVITGDPGQEPQYDLGDAPDSSNSYTGVPMTAYSAPVVLAHYPTVYLDGSPPYGPLHHDPYGLAYLGPDVTLEQEADLGPDQDPSNNILPQLDAPDRDRADDSIKLPLVLPPCQPTTFDYTVTVTTPVLKEAYVNVWFDFNRDGDWNDSIDCADGVAVPEWAVQNQVISTAVAGTFTYTTPPFTSWHPLSQDERNPLWMRITLSEKKWDASLAGGAGPAEGYKFGETEDYFIYPRLEPVQEKRDWGDAPDSPNVPSYPTLSVNNGASHVAEGPWFGDRSDQPDVEADGQPNAFSMGDDLDTSSSSVANDDEDGIGVSVAPLVPGDTGDIMVMVNGGGGVVQAWIDFDADGAWQASEQVYNAFLPDGVHNLSFPVPSTAVSGLTHARFRISRNGGLGPGGPAPDGEVEDHMVPIWKVPPDLKWLQLPDVSRNGVDVRLSTSPSADGTVSVARSLADDFECTCYGRITNVHLWGSWKDDKKGQIQRIRVRFRPDDPVGAPGNDPTNRYSKPGPAILWEGTFTPGQFSENIYHQLPPPGEWWWDPLSGELRPGGDRRIWEVHIPIDPNKAFLQEGTPEKPIIYWMEVQVLTTEGEFGWKTRRWPEHFMDDAVIGVGSQYHELRYPEGHPYYQEQQQSMDLAFYLTCQPEEHNIPTFLPAAETQCPPVVTECPPVQTRCRAAQTWCPPVRTICPAAVTKCPPVQTLCAAKKTKCPALATRCPVVKTQCPPVGTLCPSVDTRCPSTETQCPAVQTQCPPYTTECPMVETQCTFQETYCPVVETECPPVQTQCPATETECYTQETYCPAVATECPPVDTRCPPTDTACPAVDTRCPPADTRCPPEQTKCPPEQTKCPMVATECYTKETTCPPVETECPPTDTKCPVVDTRCPPTDTKCPVVQTQCPPVQTECPMVETECYPVDTYCPVVQTQCPPPPAGTACDPTGGGGATGMTVSASLSAKTESPCPVVEADCPSVWMAAARVTMRSSPVVTMNL